MKTIGMIGGMSWESTLEYYRIMNETVKDKLGGFHSAKILIYSVDFGPVEQLQHEGDWDELTKLMVEAARRVEKGGADFLIVCSNTMHQLADAIAQSVNIPILHIADVTAEEIKKQRIQTVGLLGTKFTMEQDFYKGRLTQRHGLTVIIPSEEERNVIHSIIYDELCLGQIKDVSKEAFKGAISDLETKGAGGIILGCTEIPLIVKPSDYEVPLFDTSALHARAAVDLALLDA